MYDYFHKQSFCSNQDDQQFDDNNDYDQPYKSYFSFQDYNKKFGKYNF